MSKETQEKYWHTKLGFRNPEGGFLTSVFISFNTIRWAIAMIFGTPYRLGVDLPVTHVLSRDEALQLRKKYENVPSATWLGHASFLFRIGNVQILTDPFLLSAYGPFFTRRLKRLPNPLTMEDLGDINILLVSHQHSDHLHHPSLASLLKKSIIQLVTPLGVSKKIVRHGFKKTIELDWFETNTLSDITITAVPAVHYSNFFSSTLWAGFVISFKDNFGVERKIYFSGDTGYGSFAARDVAPYGPFDVACIGVGAFYLKFPSRAPLVHTSPEQAIQISKDVDALKIIGMHWGTIRMTDEDPNEIYPRMKKHAEQIGYTGKTAMLRIGETVAL